MKVLHDARGAGKTTALIDWMNKEPGRMLVVISAAEAARLISLYPHLNGRIKPWREYTDKARMLGQFRPKEVAIDNVDIILQSMCRDDVKIISISREESK